MYVDYEDLTASQKAEADFLPWNDGWAARRWFMFWVKPDGHVSRRNGHYTLNERARTGNGPD